MTHKIYIALGTNLGVRMDNLNIAITSLSPEIVLLQRSRVYETEPWGYADQPAFLNMVVSAETELSPFDLLKKLKGLEGSLGRVPIFKNGPRLIDMDILFYDDLIMKSDSLTIPHPRLHERAFVLIPMLDIAPDFVHPILGKTIAVMCMAQKTDGVSPYIE